MSANIDAEEDLRDLYRDLILDHARSPRHFGRIDEPTHTAEGVNPLCGDKLKMYFCIDDQGTILDARFEGSGCAISIASASLLTDALSGRSIRSAREYFEAMINLLTGEVDDISNLDLGKLIALQGVRDFPSRVKCATLAWHALNCALNKNQSTATTE